MVIEVAVTCAYGRCGYSSSAVAKGENLWVRVGRCGLLGIRNCELASKGNIYLCARHVNAYAPPHTLLTYPTHSESNMTWDDG